MNDFEVFFALQVFASEILRGVAQQRVRDWPPGVGRVNGSQLDRPSRHFEGKALQEERKEVKLKEKTRGKCLKVYFKVV